MAEPAQSANAPTKDAPVTPPTTPGAVPKKYPKGVVLGKDGKPYVPLRICLLYAGISIGCLRACANS